jgi:hypothetical protein
MSNRPPGQSCEVCRFFAEVVDKPARESMGQCVLFPVPQAPIRRTYWCGQFKSAGEVRERVRDLVLALLFDGRTYEPFAYADVVQLAIQYDEELRRRGA